jgi:hypothetical protein
VFTNPVTSRRLDWLQVAESQEAPERAWYLEWPDSGRRRCAGTSLGATKGTAGVDGRMASREHEGRAASGAMVAAASPSHHVLASRLLQFEVSGQQGAEPLAEATERVFARLRRRLVVVVGAAGYEALAAARWAVGTDGALTGACEYAMAVDAPAATDGLTAIVASLIGLLVTFIGEDLTHGLVQGAWTEFASDTDSTEEHD